MLILALPIIYMITNFEMTDRRRRRRRPKVFFLFLTSEFEAKHKKIRYFISRGI